MKSRNGTQQCKTPETADEIVAWYHAGPGRCHSDQDARMWYVREIRAIGEARRISLVQAHSLVTSWLAVAAGLLGPAVARCIQTYWGVEGAVCDTGGQGSMSLRELTMLGWAMNAITRGKVSATA